MSGAKLSDLSHNSAPLFLKILGYTQEKLAEKPGGSLMAEGPGGDALFAGFHQGFEFRQHGLVHAFDNGEDVAFRFIGVAADKFKVYHKARGDHVGYFEFGIAGVKTPTRQ
jgi:hypothetical protein